MGSPLRLVFCRKPGRPSCSSKVLHQGNTRSVCAFVDTTGAEKNFLIMDINYGEYCDVMTAAVK